MEGIFMYSSRWFGYVFVTTQFSAGLSFFFFPPKDYSLSFSLVLLPRPLHNHPMTGSPGGVLLPSIFFVLSPSSSCDFRFYPAKHPPPPESYSLSPVRFFRPPYLFPVPGRKLLGFSSRLSFPASERGLVSLRAPVSSFPGPPQYFMPPFTTFGFFPLCLNNAAFFYYPFLSLTGLIFAFWRPLDFFPRTFFERIFLSSFIFRSDPSQADGITSLYTILKRVFLKPSLFPPFR